MTGHYGWSMTGFETRAIHVGQEPESTTGAVVPPMFLSTTFAQPEVGEPIAGYDYGRAGTPTRTQLEDVVASLENASRGYAFSSGQAAQDAVLRLLGPTDHIIIPHDAYGGTFRLISQIHAPKGLEYTSVDFSDSAALEAAWKPNTKLVWIESPTNPTLSIVDIARVADLAKSKGAMVVVDNTFATPYLQQPIDLGADIVVHSLTKYMGGHSDTTGGFVATNDNEIADQIYFQQKAVGAMLAPFDCYLTQRGIKTLAVRMERHCDNAEAVSEFLAQHPKVEAVLYPGLASHPGHDVATKQMRRYGGMVSFLLAGGEDAALKLVTRTSVFTLAESLGAVESLIEHPGKMTHASAVGSPLEVSNALVRLSVGIESQDDLIADLDQALAAI
jgi:cystathionine gamma-synthase